MKINVNIPNYWLVGANDYHEFDNMLENYKIILPQVKYEEVGFYGGYYESVFWIGKKPTAFINKTKKEYSDLMNKNKT